MSPTETVKVTARCDTIIPRIREDSSLKLVVVVDENNLPVGILERIEIDPEVYARYGVKVYNIQNTTCRASF